MSMGIDDCDQLQTCKAMNGYYKSVSFGYVNVNGSSALNFVIFCMIMTPSFVNNEFHKLHYMNWNLDYHESEHQIFNKV